jgi:hypothetical protein
MGAIAQLDVLSIGTTVELLSARGERVMATGVAGGSGGGLLTAYGADLSTTSTPTQQFVDSLSFSATGFAHGAVTPLPVNGTGAGLNWIDDVVLLEHAGVALVSLGQVAGDFVKIGATSVAAAGNVRVSSATTAVAARNAGNTADLPLLATDGSDNVAIGGGAAANVLLEPTSGGVVSFRDGVTEYLHAALASSLATLSASAAVAGLLLTQATTASANAGPIELRPQTSSATNGNPGSVEVLLAVPPGSGTFPQIQEFYGVNVVFQVGAASNSSSQQAIWVLPLAFAATPGNSNFGVNVQSSGILWLNGPFGTGIWLDPSGGLLTRACYVTTSGLQVGSFNPDFGSGVMVLALSNVVTEPTTTPVSSGVHYTRTGAFAGAVALGIGNYFDEYAAAGFGTQNSQVGQHRRQAAFLRDSTSGTPITIFTYAMPASGHIATLEVLLQSTNTVSVTSNSGAAKVAASFQNAAGTVTQISTTSTIYAHTISAGSLIFTISGTNVLVQVQDPDAVIRDATVVLDAFEN